MTTEYEAPEQPLRGEDGKYQIRIESYDPARNTMKAIWLVSRNQRLLSQLLDKCEVSNSETSNAALRGNLLSVQRELQELREVMDHSDGTQTPVVDTSDLGLGCGFEETESSALLSTFSDTAPPSSSSNQDGEVIPTERASSAFGFGASNRRRSVLSLSRIPKYSRPSIRTDFCVSSFEPFPDLRAKPSKIANCPKPVKKRCKKSMRTAPPRPKTSLNGRSSRLNSSRDSGVSGRTSILKTSSQHRRPATSMALTRSAPKRVSFEDTIEAPRKPSHVRPTSSDKKKKATPAPLKTARLSEVRPATSMGLRTIPRTSSRLSNRNLESVKGRSGRHSAMETSTRARRPASRGPVRQEVPLRKKETAPKTPATKNRGAKTGLKTTTKAADKKPKLPLRPKSAIDVRPSLRPDVLPFESPPPQPTILDTSLTFTTFSENSREESASPLIRSISIIDDDSENDDPFYAAKRQLPKIRVGEGEPSEYKVKAYFLDEMGDLVALDQLTTGVIPSSPVELDSSVTRDSIPEPQLPSNRAVSVNNTSPTATQEPIRAQSAECNNTEAMETDEITSKAPPSEQTQPEQASVEATPSRDPVDLTAAFPELGMEFLPEFESEVHGLLDTLMSQDLLTSSFSQDFRLFSTESNFMDTNHAQHPNEPAEKPHELQDDNQEETTQVIKELNEMETAKEREISSEAATAAILEQQEHRQLETRNEQTASEQENLNKDHSSDLAIDVAEGAVSNVLDDDDVAEDDVGGNYEVEPEREFSTSMEVPSGVASLKLLSSSLEGELLTTSVLDDLSLKSAPVSEAVRRKSTGSQEPMGVPLTSAALKSSRHHRSASQNELDAIQTHFDGRIHSFPSPGTAKGDLRWSEDVNLPHVDPSLNAETCSMYASSELTLPDPCETYHDVHHGYSPSFTAASCQNSKKGEEDCCQSLLRSHSQLPSVEWCVFNPVGLVNSSQPRQASFDFLNGNRTAIESYSETPKSQIPAHMTLLRTPTLHAAFTETHHDVEFDTVSSGKILTTTGGELDEIEACSTMDHPKDPFLKSTGSYSTWDEHCDKEPEVCRGRHNSEGDSEESHSVIPTMVEVDTDEDTVEDVPSSLSTSHRASTSFDPPVVSPKRVSQPRNKLPTKVPLPAADLPHSEA